MSLSDTLTLFMTLGIWAGMFAALYAVYQQNRIARELQRVQLFLQLAQQYDSLDMQRKRGALAESLLKNPTDVDLDDTVLTFFENLAHLRRRGMVEDEMAWNFISVDVIFFHAATAHYVKFMREKFSAQHLFEEFENLAKSWQQNQYRVVTVNAETTAEFLRWTLRVAEAEIAIKQH